MSKSASIQVERLRGQVAAGLKKIYGLGGSETVAEPR